MRIYGVTTCVGELYAGYLAKGIAAWLEGLDGLVVVTDACRGDVGTMVHGNESIDQLGAMKLVLVFTDEFTRDGAHFNKGAALNRGVNMVRHAPDDIKADWILSFDCDILPPDGWRHLIVDQLEPGKLHTSARYNASGTLEDPPPLEAKGYFQLWHADDYRGRRNPTFEAQHRHAARYDYEFASRWPGGLLKDLQLHLVHQGQRSKHWFGVGADPKLMDGLQQQIRTERLQRPPGALQTGTQFDQGQADTSDNESLPKLR